MVLMKFLLDNGVDINAIDNVDNETALHVAVRWIEKKDAVQLLLSRGADVTIRDKQGNTALDIAEAKELNEIIDLLKRYMKENNSIESHIVDSVRAIIEKAMEHDDKNSDKKTLMELNTSCMSALDCLRIIANNDKEDFFIRRKAIWWGGHFGDIGFMEFLDRKFISGRCISDLMAISKKTGDMEEEGLFRAAQETLKGIEKITT